MYLTSWFCISHSQGISNKSPQGLHIMLKFQQNHNLPHGQLMLIFSNLIEEMEVEVAVRTDNSVYVAFDVI